MKKEDIAVVAQLLEAIKEDVDELEKAKNKGDSEQVLAIKREILKFHKKVTEIL